MQVWLTMPQRNIPQKKNGVLLNKKCSHLFPILCKSFGGNQLWCMELNFYVDDFSASVPSPFGFHRDMTTNLFICHLCSYSTSRKADMERHQRTHTGEKPFTCPVCGRRFPDNRGLTIHLRSHTFERPFKCLYCKYAFTDRSNRKKHMKRCKSRPWM